jgi:hypothetical protein
MQIWQLSVKFPKKNADNLQKKSKYKKTLIYVKYDLLPFDTWEKIDIFATVNLNIM